MQRSMLSLGQNSNLNLKYNSCIIVLSFLHSNSKPMGTVALTLTLLVVHGLTPSDRLFTVEKLLSPPHSQCSEFPPSD